MKAANKFRRRFLFLAAVSTSFLSSLCSAVDITATGPFLGNLDRLDATITALMAKYDAPGAQLAVARNGRLVLARGYGTTDRSTANPVQPDSLFRIASLSKFVTATAVLSLAEAGKLDLDARAFALIPQLTPLPGATVDSRLASITVRQLLQHTGGWDRDISGDPMFNSTAIAAAAGTTAPASAETVIRYMLGRPLDFDPGSRYAYSNFGYNVLGRIIERISGQPYATYVRERVLERAGASRVVTGKSLESLRLPEEVRYHDFPGAPLVRSVFPPTSALVPYPYGGFNLEAMDSHGGWLANAIDYVRIFSAVDGSRAPSLLGAVGLGALTARPAAPVSVGAASYYGMGLSIRPVNNNTGTGANWWHNGSLPGTVTYAVRLAGGWTWALFFNTRPQQSEVINAFMAEIDNSVNTALGNLTAPASGDLLVSALPQILTQPRSQQVEPGGKVVLEVAATSVSVPAYQWLKDGQVIAGATGLSLVLQGASAIQNGRYQLTVTNAAGTATSEAAAVAVGPAADVGRLANLSIMTTLADARDTLTLGYVIGGVGTAGGKPLVIRAAGPSLATFGVPGTVEDPRIELFAAGLRTGGNDDWGGSATLAAAMAGVGGFPYLGPGSKDAAVAATLPARDNSVIVSATGGGSVIAEIYDATPGGGFTSATPRLINLSVLKQLGTGFTIGFVVGGSNPVRVLVRAVGPSISVPPFNVAEAHPDPQLMLFSGPNRIGTNNDWGGTKELTAAFSQVGAFPLLANSRDAALVVTLPPGSYSAQVGGAAGASGLVIVEVYEVR